MGQGNSREGLEERNSRKDSPSYGSNALARSLANAGANRPTQETGNAARHVHADVEELAESLERGDHTLFAAVVRRHGRKAAKKVLRKRNGDTGVHILAAQGSISGLNAVLAAALAAAAEERGSHLSAAEAAHVRKKLVNVINAKGRTPLISACKHGQLSAAQWLLEHGADALVHERHGGATCMHHAASAGNEALVRALAAATQSLTVSSRSSSHRERRERQQGQQLPQQQPQQAGTAAGAPAAPTGTSNAASGSAPQPISPLINMTTQSGLTPLHYAVWHKRHRLVPVLCELGANLYAQTCRSSSSNSDAVRGEEGSTPFHVAASVGSLRTAMALMREYANLIGQQQTSDAPVTDPRLVVDRVGNLPFVIALRNEHVRLLHVLHPLTSLTELFANERPEDRVLGVPRLMELAARVAQRILLDQIHGIEIAAGLTDADGPADVDRAATPEHSYTQQTLGAAALNASVISANANANAAAAAAAGAAAADAGAAAPAAAEPAEAAAAASEAAELAASAAAAPAAPCDTSAQAPVAADAAPAAAAAPEPAAPAAEQQQPQPSSAQQGDAPSSSSSSSALPGQQQAAPACPAAGPSTPPAPSATLLAAAGAAATAAPAGVPASPPAAAPVLRRKSMDGGLGDSSEKSPSWLERRGAWRQRLKALQQGPPTGPLTMRRQAAAGAAAASAAAAAAATDAAGPSAPAAGAAAGAAAAAADAAAGGATAADPAAAAGPNGGARQVLGTMLSRALKLPGTGQGGGDGSGNGGGGWVARRSNWRRALQRHHHFLIHTPQHAVSTRSLAELRQSFAATLASGSGGAAGGSGPNSSGALNRRRQLDGQALSHAQIEGAIHMARMHRLTSGMLEHDEEALARASLSATRPGSSGFAMTSPPHGNTRPSSTTFPISAGAGTGSSGARSSANVGRLAAQAPAPAAPAAKAAGQEAQAAQRQQQPAAPPGSAQAASEPQHDSGAAPAAAAAHKRVMPVHLEPEHSEASGSQQPGSEAAAEGSPAHPLVSLARALSNRNSAAASRRTSRSCDDTCGVCLDSGHFVALQKCGHRLCVTCAKELVRLHDLKPALCPFCRRFIWGFADIPAQ